MAEHASEPVTYYANVVTMNLGVDEMAMEFRRFTPSHRENIQRGGHPITQEDLYQVDPVVRVIVTFTAAKSMRDFLNQVVPEIEKLRKAQ